MNGTGFILLLVYLLIVMVTSPMAFRVIFYCYDKINTFHIPLRHSNEESEGEPLLVRVLRVGLYQSIVVIFSLGVFLPYYSVAVQRGGSESATFAGLVSVEVTPDRLLVLTILLLLVHSIIRVTAFMSGSTRLSPKESIEFRDSLFSYLTSFGITLYLISVLNIGIAIYNFETYSFAFEEVFTITMFKAAILTSGIIASPFIMALISEGLLFLLGVPDHHYDTSDRQF